ncbi:MAG: MBL fold metallo-hydrolase [Thermodesulfobacteriota bacterium]|nr:MBL fold metallo-hydrolase [Thermodesulfobacteriota bacterium]
MKLIIHRGTKEIGGSCVELRSEKTRIIIDLGMPLVNEQNEPFDSKQLEGKSIPELIGSHVLPEVSGLYAGEEKSVDAVLISHPHQDHYGLPRYINPEIPVYMSKGCQALIEASDIFIPTKANLRNVTTFKMREPFIIDDLVITPQLVDHSGFDAAAFLIEGGGKKILYSGDFRGHGRKGILFEDMIHHPVKDIDYLLLEGSMLGRGEGLYPSEQAVEVKMASIFKNKSNIAFVFCSSQNIDRLVSIYRAAKRTSQTLVIDLYTAYILDSLKDISGKLPQYWWPDIRVFYFWGHRKMLKDNGLGSFVEKCVSARIYKEEISRDKKNMVMITKYNSAFKRLIGYLGDLTGALGVYSMWEGYLEQSDFRKPLQRQGIEFETIHTSGHAPERDLKQLVESFKPKCIVPIHTFHPQEYRSLFSDTNVKTLNDGEEFIL